MLNRTYFTLPFVALALSLASQAVADVAPPADYVEECTIAKKQTATSECLACQSIRYGEGLDRCNKLLSAYCYTNVCSAWGGTVYAQVWCRTKAANAPALPASVTGQLDGTGAPVLDAVGGAGGAANCVPYTAPASAGSAGSSDGSTTTDSGGDTGCSLGRTRNTSVSTSLGFLGLLGLMLVANRRQAR